MQRHTFDVVSFLFGMFFFGAAAFALIVGDELSGFDGRWVWPTIIIVAGVVVLGSALARKAPAAESAEESSQPMDPIH